jgi:hypothetical protein
VLAVKGNYTLAFFPCTMGIWQVNAMVRTATFLPCPGAQLAANSSTSTLGRPPVWPVTCDDASRAHRIAVRVVERTWLLHLTSKALRQTYRCHLTRIFNLNHWSILQAVASESSGLCGPCFPDTDLGQGFILMFKYRVCMFTIGNETLAIIRSLSITVWGHDDPSFHL